MSIYLRVLVCLRLFYYYQFYAFIILWKQIFSVGKYRINVGGNPFLIRKNNSDFSVWSSIYLFNEFKFNVDISSPKIIIDLGANNGASAIYFSQKFPEAKIIAIEPDEENFKILQDNTSYYPRIKPLQAAIWNSNSFVSLKNNDAESWSKQFIEADNGIKAFTMDQLLLEFGLKKVDLLKVDIEGAESKVFDGDINWIKNVDRIICELHDSIDPHCSFNFYKAVTKRHFVQTIIGEKVLVRFTN